MQKMKPLLSRALVAFLFALGLTLPVLGALDLMAHAFPCAALLLGLCAILAAASLHRRVKLVLGIAALAGIGLYLSVLGGWQSPARNSAGGCFTVFRYSGSASPGSRSLCTAHCGRVRHCVLGADVSQRGVLPAAGGAVAGNDDPVAHQPHGAAAVHPSRPGGHGGAVCAKRAMRTCLWAAYCPWPFWRLR